MSDAAGSAGGEALSGRGGLGVPIKLNCMGEQHEVRLGKSLVFAAHSIKELELLAGMGERSGCAGFLWAWRQQDLSALWNLCPESVVADRVDADARIHVRRRNARWIPRLDREGRRKNILTAAVTDMWALLRREMVRLKLGTESGWAVWLAARSWPDGRCHPRDARLRVGLLEEGKNGIDVWLWFGLRWHSRVWSKGMALVDHRLVLARRDDGKLEILDLSSPSLVSLAVLDGKRIARTEPLMAPTSGGCGVLARFGDGRAKSNNTD